MKKHSPAFLNLVTQVKKNIKEVNISFVKHLLNQHGEFLLIDVREDSEWEKGHLPRAIHLSKGVIERDIEKIALDKNGIVCLYCGGGFRSALAADNLQKMGYCNVISMDGGFSDWEEAGYPIEKDEV